MHKPKSDLTFEEIDQKITEYKQNLLQIETILDREKEKSTQLQSGNVSLNRINDLLNLKKDLIQAINFQEDLKKFKFQTDPNIFNSSPLIQNLHQGKICQAFYEAEFKWYMAMINLINQTDQTAEITWLGFKEKTTLPWAYIKVQDSLKPEDLEVGMNCEAIYYEDGKWYLAAIEKISELGVHVKYKKYEDIEVVSFDSIRITPEQKLANIKRKEQEHLKQNSKDEAKELEFKIPDYLKISPADNEAQRLSKRKRVKSMKNTHKQKVLEKISKDKQDEWINFSQKTNKIKGYAMPIHKKEVGK